MNLQIESDRDRRWDDSLLSKDDAKAIFLSKREAAIKRERIKEYTLSHRVSGLRVWYRSCFLFSYHEKMHPFRYMSFLFPCWKHQKVALVR